MKIKIDNYLFNKTAKTVTFTGYTAIDPAAVLLITNVTDNIIIYNFADAAKGGSAATNVLTLDYDTSTMDDADDLQIFYEDTAVIAATEAKQDSQSAQLSTLNSLIETLQNLVSVLTPLGGAMNSGAPGLRVTPNAATLPISGSVTATVASTVVSSITNFGTSIPASEMAHDINNFTVTLANINNVTS